MTVDPSEELNRLIYWQSMPMRRGGTGHLQHAPLPRLQRHRPRGTGHRNRSPPLANSSCVKMANACAPFLRRPFSVFEEVRAPRERSSRRTDPAEQTRSVTPPRTCSSTPVAGDVVSCLGPLGRPFDLVDPPSRGLDGGRRCGAGASTRRSRKRSVSGNARDTNLWRRNQSSRCSISIGFGPEACEYIVATEDGSAGNSGRVTLPLERELQSASSRNVVVYACGPEPNCRSRRVCRHQVRPEITGFGGTGHGVRPGRLLQLCHPGSQRPWRPALRQILYCRSRLF